MTLEEVDDKVSEVLEILKRIESRQIHTTEMVERVKEAEPPPTGSFGTSEIPPKS